MEIQSQTNKIIFFIIGNAIMVLLLYNIPINNNPLFDNICVFKKIFGTECWNCGMTRAFLSILHCNFDIAINYNKNVIVIFPFTIIMYLYSWYKFIWKKNS